MNRFLIFAGARTGSVTLSHCLRHTIASNFEVWKDPVFDEPFTEPLKLPDGLKKFMMNECFKLGIDFTLKGVRYKDSWTTAPPERGKPGRGKKTINKISIPQLYKLLDAIYDEYIGIKHIHNQNLIWFNKALFDYAAYNGIKIIYLHRRNVYETVLSKIASESSNIWSLIEDGGGEKSYKDRVEAVNNAKYAPISMPRFRGNCRGLLNNTKAFEDYISHKEFTHKKVYYEDLIGDNISHDQRIERFKDILNFLDYEYNDNKEITDALLPKIKQHNKDVYAKIPNIDEVYEWIEQQSDE